LEQIEMGEGLAAVVVAVHASQRHGFSKEPQEVIRLIAGLGVAGDAHAGATTQHRYLVKKDPSRRNLTQVHLIHAELFEELRSVGLPVSAGEMGENVTTSGVDLLELPVGARVHLGEAAVVEVTGLRDPCSQLNQVQPGLMKALIGKDVTGRVVRKAGIMGVVLAGGEVRAGDAVRIALPEEPWVMMGPV
jgi:MOSC domain-containing protein YiiM